jgi:hypothetical protein
MIPAFRHHFTMLSSGFLLMDGQFFKTNFKNIASSLLNGIRELINNLGVCTGQKKFAHNLSIMWFLVKTQVEIILKHISRDASFSRHKSPSNGVKYIAAVLFFMMIHGTLLGVQ